VECALAGSARGARSCDCAGCVGIGITDDGVAVGVSWGTAVTGAGKRDAADACCRICPDSPGAPHPDNATTSVSNASDKTSFPLRHIGSRGEIHIDASPDPAREMKPRRYACRRTEVSCSMLNALTITQRPLDTRRSGRP
jgi:hypothetical protein